MWEDITPAPFGTPSNMQTASVVVDPLNPSTIYASAANNTNGGGNSTGVYESTDCGANWKQVSTGQNSASINSGLLWEMKFDSTGANLYVANGYGSPPALFKSSNHGVDWINLFAGKSFALSGDTKVITPVPLAQVFSYGGFVQAFSIDPTDSTQQHIVVTFHETCFDGISAAQGGWGIVGIDAGIGCLGESLDGGVTWRVFPSYQSSQGWVEASTVSALGLTTYLHITPNGVYYTDDGGTIWQPVYYTSDGGISWNLMGKAYSAYGENGYFGSDGTVYIAEANGPGIFYSKAVAGNLLGAPKNWTLIPNSPQTGNVFSDGTTLYAGWGIYDHSGQPFYSAPLNNLSNWTRSTSTTAPSNPVQGSNEYAYDSVNHIMYSANYSGGLLRMVTSAH